MRKRRMPRTECRMPIVLQFSPRFPAKSIYETSGGHNEACPENFLLLSFAHIDSAMHPFLILLTLNFELMPSGFMLSWVRFVVGFLAWAAPGSPRAAIILAGMPRSFLVRVWDAVKPPPPLPARRRLNRSQ